MNIHNVFPSKYLSSGDLNGRDTVVTMNRIVVEQVGSNGDQLPIVYFDKATKGMVLNKTNARTITSLYGPETDNWAGKAITLFATEVPFGDKIVPAIRVRPAVPGNGSAQAAAPIQTVDADVDESDIPF